jgi:hypothetical protein
MAKCLKCSTELERQQLFGNCSECAEPNFVTRIWASGAAGIQHDLLVAYLRQSLGIEESDVYEQFEDPFVNTPIEVTPCGRTRRYTHIIHLGYEQRYTGGWGPAGELSPPPTGFLDQLAQFEHE